MPDLRDYLYWRGDLSLAQAKWNEADAMVLARLSYAPFDPIAKQIADQPMKISDAALALLRTPDIEKNVIMKEDLDLLRELSTSARYGDMLLNHYVNRVDEETQTQFSAVTIHMDDTLDYVSFRGTDNTLVGWKENFNMSFLFPVPAQKSAVAYLNTVAMAFDRRMIVGGHSKGGNLAMYAAAYCAEETQSRIERVYNFDGPGFDGKIISTSEYQRICGKMVTYIPQSSIVGLLLEHEEQYIIVESLQKTGYLQHDIYTWAVEREHLKTLDHVTHASRFLDLTLKGWIADMDVDQREQFINALYSIISQTKARTLQEMDDKWFECAVAILSSLSNVDEKTWKLITQCLSLFMNNVKRSVSQLDEIWRGNPNG